MPRSTWSSSAICRGSRVPDEMAPTDARRSYEQTRVAAAILAERGPSRRSGWPGRAPARRRAAPTRTIQVQTVPAGVKQSTRCWMRSLVDHRANDLVG